MFFASDNWAGAHPAISENLSRHAGGFASAYGTSELDKAVEKTFCEIFEREVAVFFVATGTAANSLSAAAFARPGGIMLAYRDAHMITDEGGAPEFLTGGVRMADVDGPDGKVDPDALAAAIRRYSPGSVHSGQVAGISVTQATEIGTVYSLAELDAIGAIARENKLPVHMDGARFANALVSLGTTPAEMTWKRGIDVVSFGGTKNGCWCAEAVVFMNPEQVRDFPYIRKRSAQLFSKSRFIAAQFEAYLKDGLWLDSARHANATAKRLADRIASSKNARLGWSVDANELFPIIRNETVKKLQEAGAAFYPWPTPAHLSAQVGPDESLARLVTSFATTEEEIDRFADLLG